MTFWWIFWPSALVLGINWVVYLVQKAVEYLKLEGGETNCQYPKKTSHC